ncbi:PrsW family glutamic-type intramembrane protease [Streptomyces sp. NPDC005931]|uniref:PrsW family glutamic-type intramembrane protease n=1 Tax=Streptomyces sp. NPDC005931 TaxID=3364737 RepID=UPI0036AA2CAE
MGATRHHTDEVQAGRQGGQRRPHFRRWMRVWWATMALSLLLAAVAHSTGNSFVLPAAFFYGAAAGPIALLVATQDRTGIAASVPAVTLLGTFLFGGGVAIVLGGFFDALFVHPLDGPRILRVGFIEEPAKILTVIAVAAIGGYRTKRSGLALGLATATGFAVMESMAYALATVPKGVFRAETVELVRGLTTPFGHLAWTGFFCAVAFGVWERRGRMVLTLPIAGVFLLVCLLHSLNDALLTLHDVPVAVHLLYGVVAATSYVLFHRSTRDLTGPSPHRVPVPAG